MGEPLTLGTAGHIDHGKTALVAALTGTDTDRLPEERRRGISIALGYARLALPSGRALSVVDVPGHERFVRTMVAGATGIDCFLAVVAADDGVMPQTREHAAVLRALGVTRGVVAVTKADLADPARAAGEAAELFAGVAAVPVSARTGEGLDGLRAALDRLAAATPSRRASAAESARLHVDRVFSVRGAGTVVTGTLWSGALRRGDALDVLPQGLRARVRGVQVHDADVDVAGAGQRVAVNLAGLDRDEVARGDVLVGDPPPPGHAAPSDAALFDAASGNRAAPSDAASGNRAAPSGAALSDAASGTRPAPSDAASRSRAAASGAAPSDAAPVGSAARPAATFRVDARLDCVPPPRVAVHHGTRESEARAVDLGDGLWQLRLREPVVAAAGDRVVLRAIAPPDTLGGGVVVDPDPVRRSRDTPLPPPRSESTAHVAANPDLAPAEVDEVAAAAVLGALRAEGLDPPHDDDLDPAGDTLAALRDRGDVVRIGPATHLAAEVYAGARDTVVGLLEAEGTVTLARVRDALGSSRRVVQAVLERLDADRVTLRRGDERVLRRRRDPAEPRARPPAGDVREDPPA